MSNNWTVLYFLALWVPAPVVAQQKCEDLKSLSLPGVTIGLAIRVAAGPFTLPSGRSVVVDAPDFCRVAGVIDPEVNFELWMPAQWNHKLLAVGNGGLAGTISYAPMVEPLRRGYATSSTDTGHTGNGQEAGWAQGHMERVITFGHRAIHMMTQADKAILQAFYGAQPAHSYFSGCSLGGRQAMVEAQRYPKDFDGIVAGDPANFWTHHYIGGHLWAVLATQGDAYIPASKIPLIANAVNNLCDGLDGIRDGILNDPRRCHFDPAVLLCKGSDQPTCLTAAQSDTPREAGGLMSWAASKAVGLRV